MFLTLSFSTIHAPAFQWKWIILPLDSFVSMHQVFSFYCRVWYLLQRERERERERERQGERDRERERERDKEKWTYFFTGTKLVKACHCVEYSVAMKTKFINLETVNFLRSACSVEAFNFRFWSCSLEIGHDLIPYFQSYGSCFNEVWIYWFLNRDPIAYKHRSVSATTWSRL